MDQWPSRCRDACWNKAYPEARRDQAWDGLRVNHLLGNPRSRAPLGKERQNVCRKIGAVGSQDDMLLVPQIVEAYSARANQRMICRHKDDQLLAPSKLAAQVAMVRNRAIETDVHSAAKQIADLQSGCLLVKPDADQRMLAAKLCQKFCQACPENGSCCANIQRPMLARQHFLHLEQGAIMLSQDTARTAQEHLSGACQRHLAAGPLKQRGANRPFKGLYLKAQGRLGHIQALGGTGKVELLGQDNEALQLANSHIKTIWIG